MRVWRLPALSDGHCLAAALIWIIIVRLGYAAAVGRPLIQADTTGYFGMGGAIAADPLHMFVNEYRTPLYPLILNAARVSAGLPVTEPVGSDAFNLAMWPVIVLQNLAAVGGLVCLWWMLTLWTGRSGYAAAAVAAIGTNPLILSWDCTLMADSLVTSIMLMTAALAVSVARAPSWRTVTAIIGLSLVGFLVKPGFAPLGPVVACLAVIANRTRLGTVLPLMAVLVAGTLLPSVAYSRLNLGLHGYPGINRLSDIDMLSRVIRYDIPTAAGAAEPYFAEMVRTAPRGTTVHPFRLLEQWDPAIYANRGRMNGLNRFIIAVVMANLPIYTLSTLTDIPGAFTDTWSLPNLTAPAAPPARTAVFLPGMIWFRLQPLILAVLAACPLWIVALIRKPAARHIVPAVLSSLSLVYMVLSVFVSYGEYGRLITPILPLGFAVLAGVLPSAAAAAGRLRARPA